MCYFTVVVMVRPKPAGVAGMALFAFHQHHPMNLVNFDRPASDGLVYRPRFRSRRRRPFASSVHSLSIRPISSESNIRVGLSQWTSWAKRELCRLAGSGQVRSQALEPLVADDVRRFVDTRSALPLPVGIPCLCQAGPPPLDVSQRCECIWILIWCLWLPLATMPGSKLSAADLATPAMPTADAPTTVPMRPIVIMSICRSFHLRVGIGQEIPHSMVLAFGPHSGQSDDHRQAQGAEQRCSG